MVARPCAVNFVTPCAANMELSTPTSTCLRCRSPAAIGGLSLLWVGWPAERLSRFTFSTAGNGWAENSLRIVSLYDAMQKGRWDVAGRGILGDWAHT